MTWPPPNTRKVVIPYHHEQADLQHVYLAVTAARRPASSDWEPAFRDMDHSRCREGRHQCQRVVFVRFPDDLTGRVWIKDRDGERVVRGVRL